jgi:hypothetical protein
VVVITFVPAVYNPSFAVAHGGGTMTRVPMNNVRPTSKIIGAPGLVCAELASTCGAAEVVVASCLLLT